MLRGLDGMVVVLGLVLRMVKCRVRVGCVAFIKVSRVWLGQNFGGMLLGGWST